MGNRRRRFTNVTIGTVNQVSLSEDGTATVVASTHGQIVIDGRAYQGDVFIDGDHVWVDGELID